MKFLSMLKVVQNNKKDQLSVDVSVFLTRHMERSEDVQLILCTC